MKTKSGRYFHNHNNNTVSRSHSNSPDRSSLSSSSSSSKLSTHRSSFSSSSSSSKSKTFQCNSSKYFENKTSSDLLKKSIQEQTSDTTSRPQIQTNTQLSVEEQVKRANTIEEINYNSFQPKSFVSLRNLNSKVMDIDTASIPLPKDENFWHENPKLLIDTRVCIYKV